jgi:DNA-binding FadR family transcriptional regulator
MPSIRELSETLKLSRSTILKAYEDLKTQGLVVAQSGSGTFVANTLPGDLGEHGMQLSLSPANRPVSFKPFAALTSGAAPFLKLAARDKQPNMSTCQP